MYQICRLEFFDEPVKTVKSFVAGILSVVNMARSGVRQKNVKVSAVADFVPEQGRCQRKQAEEHLAVSILAQTVVVAD